MSGGVQSVQRAFRLLDAIGVSPSGLTELARRVDLPVSTTSRLLSTLESLGAVERSDDCGSFHIGPSILGMASAARSSKHLEALARPELEWLAETSGEASGLSVAAGHAVHFLDQADGSGADIQDWVGKRVPMHLVAPGVVLLAQWPFEAVDFWLERELEAPTPTSVTDPDEIRDRLSDVWNTGVAWTFGEFEKGHNAVAAPIAGDAGDVVGAVHLHGPADRFPGDDRQRLEDSVKVAARRIGEALVASLDEQSLTDDVGS